ncbi:NAD-dependent epimerase/dehydratase family protein [Bradyrhizobium erythrophlei]|uniref:NAD-dependent epimerase/dehydratase family protein n=1 Tax=Bradyrhizobium erythrophlei TaxID=1437360 RepID=UPI0009A5BB9D|nr:NAD-dependent epimerase/dehydratase family protein [Bradyrhizobium erythrophlei]
MHSVLITGGAGFIGQNLVHAWRAARPVCGQHNAALEPLITDRRIQFVKGDIGDAAIGFRSAPTPRSCQSGSSMMSSSGRDR